MLSAWTLIPAALAAALAVAAIALHLRARRGRRQLAQAVHDHALRLDQRCDRLQAALDRLTERQRIDHLAHLVEHGRRRGTFGAEAADRLREVVLALHEESRTAAATAAD